MPSSLRGQGRDRGAVVAAQDREQGGSGQSGQLVSDVRPAGFNLRPRIEVAEMVPLQPMEGAPVLGDGRHDGGEVGDAHRRPSGSLPVDRRTVVGDAGHDDVSRVDGMAGEPTPGREPLEVHFFHFLCISGTFRMRSPPASNQMKNTVNITGYPPGRPSSFGPLLNSSRKPATKRAMTPEPAVAMLLKPMKRPASPGGTMTWMKAQSTQNKSP